MKQAKIEQAKMKQAGKVLPVRISCFRGYVYLDTRVNSG